MQPDTDYITNLITRAEPELLGSFRERHAKTLEIAQEEVLICLGICLYERLHRISLRLREEEGTCQILAAVAIDALHRKFETSVERKCGVTKLELLYEEITKEEAAKQQRKEQKKLRRRKKKERKLAGSKCDIDNEPGDIGSCECIDCIEDKRPLQSESVNKINCIEFSQPIDGDSCISCQSVPPDVSVISKPFTSSSWSSAEHSHDCGYSSEHNNGCCDTISGTSSLPSSPEGSDVACSEGFCNHERGDCTSDSKLSNIPDDLHKTSNNGFTLSLEEMLMVCSFI